MFKLKALKVGFSNTLYLVAGNILGQMLSFVFTIYVARKIGPAEFGVYNTVAAFVAMFGFLTLNGYQKVLIRETVGDTQKLSEVIGSVFCLKSIFSLLAVVLAVTSSILVRYDFRIVIFVSVYAFTLFFNNVSSLLLIVYHSHKKQKYIVYSSLLQRLIYIVPAALCLYMGGGVVCLVALYTFSTLINIGINYLFTTRLFSLKVNPATMLKFSFNKSFFRQAMVFSLLGFIGYFYSKIDITMLSLFTDHKSVGFYSAGFKLIQPVEMAGQMAAISFYPFAVERFQKKEPVSARTLFSASLVIAVVLFPLTLVISLYSGEIVSMLYGPEYEEADLILKYLCWMIPLGITTKPFILAMQANHHEKLLILPNLLRALSNVVLNYIFIMKFGYIGVVYSTIITYLWYYIVINFGYQYYVLKKAGNII